MRRPERAREERGRDARARRFLDALLRGDAGAATEIVEEARRRGLTIEQIYLHLLAPAQVEVGARWRAHRISVADEHRATEITLREMDRLRERLALTAAPGPRAVLASVEGEPHVVGLRMLGDFLLIDGWTVDYLGASIPTADLSDFVARRRPDLVALSVSQAEHLPALTVAAKALRRLSPPPRLLAGGSALRTRARAAATFGVDAVARDARGGVQEARRLIATPQALDGTVEDYFARLGRRVQELRAARGWTQQQLAKEAALDRTYVSGLERGRQNPTIGALLRLARALEVPLERLMMGAPGTGGR